MSIGYFILYRINIRGFLKLIIRAYLTSFGWLAQERIEKKDLGLRHIHAHLISVYTTGVLMWIYAWVAYTYIDNPIPGYVGLACSLAHFLTIFMFRYTNNIFLIATCMLTPGIVHQGTFSYFTGGFISNVLIWYGIIPSLAGVIAGKKAALFWGATVFTVAFGFFLGELLGHNYPNQISETGYFISHILLIFGWITTITTLLYVVMGLIFTYEKDLEVKNNRIESLFQVLIHDISNTVHIISITVGLLKRRDPENPKLESLTRNSDVLVDTITAVKEMYVLDISKKSLTLLPVPIEDVFLKITNALMEEFKDKNISILLNNLKNKKVMASEKVLANQVLKNLLTNSMKFSHPNNKIDISLEVDGLMTVITIKDYGIGMNQELLKKLFDPNSSTSRKGTSNEKGTGLGMLIVKSSIQHMGGSLEVESEENVGTTYIIKLASA